MVASIALAACALALWVAVRRNRAAGGVGIAELPGTAGGSGDDTVGAEPLDADPTLRFLVALGEAMIDSSAPVTQVTQSLRDVARVNGRPDAELIVLSTALLVSSSEGSKVQTVAASAGRRSLRLEQIDAVFDIVDEAEHAALTPRRGLDRLDEVRRMPATFSTPQRIAGYVGMALGLALVLKAGWVDLAVAGLLGVCVGTVLLATANVATAYRPFIPVGCAFGVSLVVFLLSNASADIGVFAPIVAPLVTLLPGALLTTSLIELATGDMISGAGRLAAGAMQLVLLALGIVSAAQLVGVGTSTVTDVTSAPLGVAAPWVGVAVFGLGAGVHLCARRSAIPWILLVLYVAYAGQVLGGVLLGPVLSGFVGALLLTPVAMLVSTRPTGPYTFVSFLPAFWLLVPGALGLAGVTQFLGDNRLDGAASLVTTGLAMLGIALGALLGLGAGSALAAGVRSRRVA